MTNLTLPNGIAKSRKMVNIYSGAKEDLVWPGEKADDSDKVFKLLRA
jgi:hypothetical protein